jgi:cytochrome c
MRASNLVVMAAVAVVAAAGPTIARGEDGAAPPRDPVAYGADLYAAWCSNCHDGRDGHTPFAVPLAGVIGRKAGSVEGYSFTPLIAGLGFTWSRDLLDGWLASLATEATSSSIQHVGISDPRDRAAVVAYIEALESK